MSSDLRVDPMQLQAAARSQLGLGHVVPAGDAGASMTVAARAVAGLDSATACGTAAVVLDAVAARVGRELIDHAGRVAAAAAAYRCADEELGRRLTDLAD